MDNIERIDNGVILNGKKLVVYPRKHGDKLIMDVDGRKIKISNDELILMYTFFSILYRTCSEENKKKNGDVYGN